tara:strand:- start:205 stop:339 length:135 start_codon:yes stop_codon:yes gene_type:complete
MLGHGLTSIDKGVDVKRCADLDVAGAVVTIAIFAVVLLTWLVSK